MKKVILIAFMCFVVILAATLAASNSQNDTYQEAQTVRMRLDYICPVAFKETGSWHLAGPKTFWLQTKAGGDSTQFRFFQVQDSDLIRSLPRDSLIGRDVELTVCFVGDTKVWNPFAVCELQGFKFLD